MEPIIDATISGDSANSYVTLAFADAYFADTLEAREWLRFDRKDRARALISATRKIDLLRFYGSDATLAQALKFPREGDYDADGILRIPDGIKYATCELALHILREESMVHLIGVSADYRGDPSNSFPRRVRKLLRPFVEGA